MRRKGTLLNNARRQQGARDGGYTLLHEPIPKLPHLSDPRFGVHRFGESSPELVDIFIFRDVFEELCYRAAYNTSEGSLSLLIGGWFVGPLGPYIEIEGFRDSIHADDPMRLLDYLSKHSELFAPDLPDPSGLMPRNRRLGACLALPKSSARLTPETALLYNTYFNSPYHVMLLIDADEDQFGFYARNTHGGFQSAPFWLLADDDLSDEGLSLNMSPILGPPRSGDPRQDTKEPSDDRDL